MNLTLSIARRAGTASLIAALAIAGTAPVAVGESTPAAKPLATAAGQTAIDRSGQVALALAPCGDGAYSLLGGSWAGTLSWWFTAWSTPATLNSAETEAVLLRSFANITDARNDCGLADEVGATAQYLGQTGLKPGVTRRGRCAASDGQSVIGFGRLPWGTLAVTCVQYEGDYIVEADIRINKRLAWALSIDACSYEEMLEPTMTHEIGHAYGLGHVGERRHGRLTMSTLSDGSCNDAESTLGWGDLRGLQDLYPLN